MPQLQQQQFSKSVISKSDHYPVFIRAGEGIQVINHPSLQNNEYDEGSDNNEQGEARGGGNSEADDGEDNIPKTLPLGVPIEFESPIFVGRILIRLKTIPSVPQDKDNHRNYFKGKKRYYQCIVQGKFKQENIKFSDVYFGDVYDKPFVNMPNRYIMRGLKKFMERLNPGMIYDIVPSRSGNSNAANHKPKVLNPIGSVQELSIDYPGNEPDITTVYEKEEKDGMIENTSLLFRENDTKKVDEKQATSFTSRSDRRKQLSKSNIAKDYTFDTDKIYTFHYYDHTADISNYEQDIGGILKVDLTRSLNGQPLSLSALWLKHDGDGKENKEGREQQHQYMYRFEIWHDKIL